ncbi:MAG: 16S rRNA (cytosine(1402)-N(4))-methyltransferase RsmH [Planctomycetales bacterium]|nr:16S rRNA (cytosine(1402)-N(4))-methyltransferase RsmH [Planctomycetales bacterium]
MTDLPSERPQRRTRYRGTHPQQFGDKYKEHQPELYADDVAHMVASGKTLAGTHRPVMVREILEVLAPQPGETVVDCTLGYGGHAAELLAAVQPGGRLLGVDADPIELPKTEVRLRALGFAPEALVVRRMNYAGIAGFLAELTASDALVNESEPAESNYGADVLLADLGLSSMQIDDPARGFTFKFDGPLDMRMNPARGLPASKLLSKLDADELAQLLDENADEPHAVEMATAILKAHSRSPLTTTRALTDVIRSTFTTTKHGSAETDDDAVRRVFQALRIAVNDEFGALDTFLRNLPSCLKPGGRVAILSFHSGEDRRVKLAFKQGLRDNVYASISPEIIRPSAAEQRANPRSSAAKLRYAVRR